MIPKRYIVWSKREIDISEPFQRRWYLKQVLTNGRAEDIVSLDWSEIRELLPELNLPPDVRNLWEDYFSAVW